MRTWKAFSGAVAALRFGPDGTRLAVASSDGVKAFEPATGRELWHWPGPGWATEVAFTADGRKVVALVGLRVLALDAADGRELGRYARRIAACAAPADPDRLLVLTAGMDIAEFRELNLSDGTVVWKKVLGYHGGVGRAELAPDGRTVGAVGMWEATLVDVATRRVRFHHRIRHGVRHSPALAFTPDGAALVFAERGQLHVLGVDPGELRATVAYEGPTVRALAFRPDGRAAFVARGESAVEEWDATSWAPGRSFDWKAGKLSCLAIAPGGTFAAAGSDSGKVVVWDVDV